MARYYPETKSYGLSKSEEKRYRRAWQLMSNHGERKAGCGGGASSFIFTPTTFGIDVAAVIRGKRFEIGDRFD